ncbi:MAG: hypothetical protein J6Z42_04330 [Lachnospiraceae bacterium]|nr:hypothetical protein [Lachnospiraceae bacterium]
MKKTILFCGIFMAFVLMTAGCGADKSADADKIAADHIAADPTEAVIEDQLSEEMMEDADVTEAAGSGETDTVSEDESNVESPDRSELSAEETQDMELPDTESSDTNPSDPEDALPEIEWAMDAKEDTTQASQTSQQYDASKLKSIELTDYFGQNLYFVMDDFYPDIYQSSNCFMWNDMGSWVHVEDDGAICSHGHKINTSNVSVYGTKTGQSVDDAAAVLAARGFSIESEGLDSRINQYVVRAKGSKNWVVLYYDKDSKLVNGIEVNLKDLDQGWE